MGLRLYINGTDVTNKYGGPWNPSGNVAVDISLDITDDILNASGGIYREHEIVFRADYRFSATGMYVAISDPSSSGLVELTTKVLAICQAILPT
jgi:RES domain-containing protein